MSFTKLLKTRTQDTKTTISQSVKNGCDFCCYLSDMKISNDDTLTYPSFTQLNEWIDNLFQKELKPKVYNQKALEAMAKKGIKPQIQKEILTIIIAGSETHIHLGIFVPKDMNLDVKDFIKCFMNNIEYKLNNENNYTTISYEHDSPLKETDNVKKRVFDELQRRKIYIDDESDDEMVFDF